MYYIVKNRMNLAYASIFSNASKAKCIFVVPGKCLYSKIFYKWRYLLSRCFGINSIRLCDFSKDYRYVNCISLENCYQGWMCFWSLANTSSTDPPSSWDWKLLPFMKSFERFTNFFLYLVGFWLRHMQNKIWNISSLVAWKL